MTSPLHSRFRMIVAVICGIGCLMAAAFRLQTPLAQTAVVLFGVCWFLQAYWIGVKVRG